MIRDRVAWLAHYHRTLGRVAAYLRTEDPSAGRDVEADLRQLLGRVAVELGSTERKEVVYLEEILRHIVGLQACPPVNARPWSDEVLSAHTLEVPVMIETETSRYYKWLGFNLRGIGEVVEVGAWLGGATCAIAEGLAANPRFRGRTLFALDSFRWANWMNLTSDAVAVSPPLAAGELFLDRFRDACRPYSAFVQAMPCAVGTWPDEFSDGLHRATWNGRPIELLVYDMGPVWSQLSDVWATFAPWLVPQQSVVVFNEYGKLDSDVLWSFCRSHDMSLEPLHKPWSSAKGFRYRGPSGREV